MPFDFFMSRYKEAYIQESIAFVNCLRDDAPSPCTGEDGLVALIMSIAAGKVSRSAPSLRNSILDSGSRRLDGRVCEVASPETNVGLGDGGRSPDRSQRLSEPYIQFFHVKA